MTPMKSNEHTLIVNGVEVRFPLPLTVPQSIQLGGLPWTMVKETVVARNRSHLMSLYQKWLIEDVRRDCRSLTSTSASVARQGI